MKDLTLATYNVLAQQFAEPSRYPNLPEQAARRALTLESIQALNADVLLLQEVEHDLFLNLQRTLEPTHRALWHKRPTHGDGCAIVFRRNLELIARWSLTYRAHEEGYSQVACIVRLRRQKDELTIASTHLRCGCQAGADSAPLGQLQLQELLNFASAHPSPTWIIGGDLNAPPQSDTLQQAFDAGFQPSAMTPTALIRGVKSKRDYLLHQGALSLAPSRPRGFGEIPNTAHPSDHVALCAQVATASAKSARTCALEKGF